MPRNEKEATVKPVSAKTILSGPTFRLGPGVPSCSLKIPSEILEASGLKGNDQVELIAAEGLISIVKVGDPLPGLPNHSPRNIILDNLMALTHDFEKREREARGGYNLVDTDEPEGEPESESFEDLGGEQSE